MKGAGFGEGAILGAKFSSESLKTMDYLFGKSCKTNKD